jgi:hypothetical protein
VRQEEYPPSPPQKKRWVYVEIDNFEFCFGNVNLNDEIRYVA